MATVDQRVDTLIGKIVSGTATEEERLEYDLVTLTWIQPVSTPPLPQSDDERDRFDALVKKYAQH